MAAAATARTDLSFQHRSVYQRGRACRYYHLSVKLTPHEAALWKPAELFVPVSNGTLRVAADKSSANFHQHASGIYVLLSSKSIGLCEASIEDPRPPYRSQVADILAIKAAISEALKYVLSRALEYERIARFSTRVEWVTPKHRIHAAQRIAPVSSMIEVYERGVVIRGGLSIFAAEARLERVFHARLKHLLVCC